MDFITVWETMVEMGIATDEEIGLVIALCGRTINTLNSVLYIRTGYRDLGQLIETEFAEEINGLNNFEYPTRG